MASGNNIPLKLKAYCLTQSPDQGVLQNLSDLAVGRRGRLIAAIADVLYGCCHGRVAVSCRSSSGRSAGGWTSRSAGMTSSPMSLIERINLSCSIPPNIIQLLMWVAPTLAARLRVCATTP